ncbi:efflux RND transporter permease subunit [Halioxenophilus sp. WMMB6]|uniref:efflux RND transporter permease subunit n=1 Tax=Halioxenophilus sp. WMMB6 TaxID=3073815 RepID=UPI00295E261A|nr:efflux RND transporter permease subunit [Halioxenophilus sp. WMMB6]
MLLSDVCIKRPVFASVIALLMAVFGAFAFTQLSTREYPDISPAEVSVSTSYPGASADIVENRITQVLESELSGIEGVKAMRSNSIDGRSSINIEFNLSRNIDEAANDVRDYVSRVRRRLPDEALDPQISKADSDGRPVIYISLVSESWSMMELSDYAERYVKDRFSVIPGVSSVNILGGGNPSMRIWVDKHKLIARNLTVIDVLNALRRENVELPAGRIDSETREFPVRIVRNYQSEADFRNLVVKRGDDGHLIRLGEVARVGLDRENMRRVFNVNGGDSMAIGIIKQSTANTVAVLDGIHAEMEAIAKSLPPGVTITSSGDASEFIRAAISNVYSTIFATIALVAFVMWLFLGNWRSLLIPVVCIPLSLLGSFIALWLFGYSVNLITLLAMVLSIGMVVDDAIVVLENIHRRVEEGEPPLLAAYYGARQVGFAVIATTMVLVAVFVPIGFLEDNTGQIFSELAVAIAAAVIASTLLALTMVPMMCSKLLHKGDSNNWMIRKVEQAMDAMACGYEKSLRATLKFKLMPLLLAGLSLVGSYFLYQGLEQEYAPSEDQGTLMAFVRAEEGTNVAKMREIIKQLLQPMEAGIESGEYTRVLFVSPSFGSLTPNSAFSRISVVNWDQREDSVFDIQRKLTAAWAEIPGIRAMAFVPNGLSRSGGNTPIQFVIQGDTYDHLIEWRDIIMDAARSSGLFTIISSDLNETQQQIHLSVDKNRAASLGISVNDVGLSLQALMAEQEVSQYVYDGLEYPVIMAVEDDQRNTSDDINNIYVRSNNSGKLISLANLVTIENRADISSLQRYNRLRAVTISAGLAPGVSLGEGLQFLEQAVADKLPQQAQIDYKGESLEFKESTGGIIFIFGFALLVLFLVMAAQFESFVHPTVIMFTVPLAIAGGLLGLWITQSSFNIFSQIGFLMLIGVATKNGILLVEFINQMRDEGAAFGEAIVTACKMRLRPVLMTTVSTVVGAIPLVMATGPGEASRNVLGIVVLFGVSIAALLTLYVVPGFYQLLARRTQSPEAVAKELASLQAKHQAIH